MLFRTRIENEHGFYRDHKRALNQVLDFNDEAKHLIEIGECDEAREKLRKAFEILPTEQQEAAARVAAPIRSMGIMDVGQFTYKLSETVALLVAVERDRI